MVRFVSPSKARAEKSHTITEDTLVILCVGVKNIKEGSDKMFYKSVNSAHVVEVKKLCVTYSEHDVLLYPVRLHLMLFSRFGQDDYNAIPSL